MSKISTQAAINLIRESGSELLQETIPEVTENLDINVLSSALFSNPNVANEFVNALVNKLIEQQVNIKVFNNPLRVLEGDRLPLGQAVEDIYINPAKGRNFNGDDFAGILEKYESDVKTQYLPLNMDRQYPVTISRQRLQKAFMSWDNLENFITAQTNSLYSGAYIDEYMYTKGIVSSAYKNNRAIIQKINAINSESIAKEFITNVRTLFKVFQKPSTKYNAWNKCGGAGRPVKTWCNPEDIVFIIRSDISSYIDVNVLASSFNIDKTTLLGNIIEVEDFNMYDDNDNLIFDGSQIVGIIADKAWFKIRTQDMFMDSAKNPNNRVWQYYLNYIKMYQFSLFANGVIFAESLPTGVSCTEIKVLTSDLTATTGTTKTISVELVPPNTTDTLTATTEDTNCTVTVEGTEIKVAIESGFAETDLSITAKCGTATKEITLTVS